ncbi:hypothetical protein O6072_24360 [Mycolicibacterium neoaurum]|uniref:hypothetical protein n=1 Tax=Mycolicibacterium neoaurum TaxID=1795 RepID=UPI00248AC320|nr:hypothetical protein [Mycolicibacterium neoaurum]WBP94104.1 hypothetical protein O7W24_23755 [Mycolicibacterium neoaurum]WBS07907.1 hypothetical protein O6072_24360 [Mycolicibacterium neoaurum]
MTATPALQLSAAAAVAGAALLVFSGPAGAAPESDDQGYLGSFARCASPDTAVIFGATDTSRVAICADPDGGFEYRGVRVRDGARLVLSATRSGTGYVAFNEGQSYTVTPESLVFSVGDDVIREEPLIDVHEPGTSGSSSSTSTSTSTSSAPTSSTPTSSAPTTTATTRPTTTVTVTTPLPPPGPAEVGGQLGEIFSGS